MVGKNRRVKSQPTSHFNPQRQKWNHKKNRTLNEWRSVPEIPSEKDKGMKTMEFFLSFLIAFIFN